MADQNENVEDVFKDFDDGLTPREAKQLKESFASERLKGDWSATPKYAEDEPRSTPWWASGLSSFKEKASELSAAASITESEARPSSQTAKSGKSWFRKVTDKVFESLKESETATASIAAPPPTIEPSVNTYGFCDDGPFLPILGWLNLCPQQFPFEALPAPTVVKESPLIVVIDPKKSASTSTTTIAPTIWSTETIPITSTITTSATNTEVVWNNVTSTKYRKTTKYPTIWETKIVPRTSTHYPTSWFHTTEWRTSTKWHYSTFTSNITSWKTATKTLHSTKAITAVSWTETTTTVTHTQPWTTTTTPTVTVTKPFTSILYNGTVTETRYATVTAGPLVGFAAAVSNATTRALSSLEKVKDCNNSESWSSDSCMNVGRVLMILFFCLALYLLWLFWPTNQPPVPPQGGDDSDNGSDDDNDDDSIHNGITESGGSCGNGCCTDVDDDRSSGNASKTPAGGNDGPRTPTDKTDKSTNPGGASAGGTGSTKKGRRNGGSDTPLISTKGGSAGPATSNTFRVPSSSSGSPASTSGQTHRSTWSDAYPHPIVEDVPEKVPEQPSATTEQDLTDRTEDIVAGRIFDGGIAEAFERIWEDESLTMDQKTAEVDRHTSEETEKHENSARARLEADEARKKAEKAEKAEKAAEERQAKASAEKGADDLPGPKRSSRQTPSSRYKAPVVQDETESQTGSPKRTTGSTSVKPESPEPKPATPTKPVQADSPKPESPKTAISDSAKPGSIKSELPKVPKPDTPSQPSVPGEATQVETVNGSGKTSTDAANKPSSAETQPQRESQNAKAQPSEPMIPGREIKRPVSPTKKFSQKDNKSSTNVFDNVFTAEEQQQTSETRRQERDAVERQRIAQETKARQQNLFNSTFPNGYVLVDVSGDELLCGKRALISSIESQLQRSPPNSPGVFDRLPIIDEELRNNRLIASLATGVESKNNYTSMELATMLQDWGTQHGLTLRLGMYVEGKSPYVIEESAERTPTIVWIYNDNASALKGGQFNHYQGMRPREDEKLVNNPADSTTSEAAVSSKDTDNVDDEPSFQAPSEPSAKLTADAERETTTDSDNKSSADNAQGASITLKGPPPGSQGVTAPTVPNDLEPIFGTRIDTMISQDKTSTFAHTPSPVFDFSPGPIIFEAGTTTRPIRPQTPRDVRSPVTPSNDFIFTEGTPFVGVPQADRPILQPRGSKIVQSETPSSPASPSFPSAPVNDQRFVLTGNIDVVDGGGKVVGEVDDSSDLPSLIQGSAPGNESARSGNEPAAESTSEDLLRADPARSADALSDFSRNVRDVKLLVNETRKASVNQILLRGRAERESLLEEGRMLAEQLEQNKARDAARKEAEEEAERERERLRKEEARKRAEGEQAAQERKAQRAREQQGTAAKAKANWERKAAESSSSEKNRMNNEMLNKLKTSLGGTDKSVSPIIDSPRGPRGIITPTKGPDSAITFGTPRKDSLITPLRIPIRGSVAGDSKQDSNKVATTVQTPGSAVRFESPRKDSSAVDTPSRIPIRSSIVETSKQDSSTVKTSPKDVQSTTKAEDHPADSSRVAETKDDAAEQKPESVSENNSLFSGSLTSEQLNASVTSEELNKFFNDPKNNNEPQPGLHFSSSTGPDTVNPVTSDKQDSPTWIPDLPSKRPIEPTADSAEAPAGYATQSAQTAPPRETGAKPDTSAAATTQAARTEAIDKVVAVSAPPDNKEGFYKDQWVKIQKGPYAINLGKAKVSGLPAEGGLLDIHVWRGHTINKKPEKFKVRPDFLFWPKPALPGRKPVRARNWNVGDKVEVCDGTELCLDGTIEEVLPERDLVRVAVTRDHISVGRNGRGLPSNFKGPVDVPVASLRES